MSISQLKSSDYSLTKPGHRAWHGLLGALLPLAAIMAALSIGRYPLPVSDIARYLLAPFRTVATEPAARVFWFVRAPRVILVAMTGGALALSGAAFQGLFRSPLVSPDILGASSGASLGAGIAIVLLNGDAAVIQTLAFLGGLAAVWLATTLARLARRDATVTLVLAGLVVNALTSALVSLLKYIADPYDQLPALEFWLMGSFHLADWKHVIEFLPALIIGGGIILSLRWRINILSFGTEEAKAMGVNVWLVRILLIAGSTILVASATSVAGVVSWIGLAAPHLVRMVVGPDHRKVIPMSLSAGAVLLLAADTFARSLTSSEIPISVVTAFVGAPLLAYLMWRSPGEHWGHE